MLSSFQHAVNFMKVAYMPPITDIGPYPQHIQFVLSVANHLGKTVTGICFNITIIPVDNQPPQVQKDLILFVVLLWKYILSEEFILFQVITNSLTVDEGGECWLSPEHVLLSDVDSLEEALQIELQTEPQHGALQLDGLPLKPGQTFSLHDMSSHKVRSDILKHSFLWISVIICFILVLLKNKTPIDSPKLYLFPLQVQSRQLRNYRGQHWIHSIRWHKFSQLYSTSEGNICH